MEVKWASNEIDALVFVKVFCCDTAAAAAAAAATAVATAVAAACCCRCFWCGCCCWYCRYCRYCRSCSYCYWPQFLVSFSPKSYHTSCKHTHGILNCSKHVAISAHMQRIMFGCKNVYNRLWWWSRESQYDPKHEVFRDTPHAHCGLDEWRGVKTESSPMRPITSCAMLLFARSHVRFAFAVLTVNHEKWLLVRSLQHLRDEVQRGHGAKRE